MFVEMKSQQVSAHVSRHEVCLSARAMTILPDHHSIAISARPMSEASVREQGDQITEGRFEPQMVDNCVNTGTDLMD